MKRDSHTRRQQLGPDSQIHLPLEPNVDAKADPDKASNQQASHELATPGDSRCVKGPVEVVRLPRLVKGKVGVHVLVGAKVQHEDAAEEGDHGGVLGEEADEDVADLEFLVRSVAQCREAEDGEGLVEEGSHHDGGEDYQACRGEDLEDDEL